MANVKQTSKKGTLETMHTDFIYTTESLADLLGLKEATVRKYYTDKTIVGYKKAGRLYFLHSDVIEFIKG